MPEVPGRVTERWPFESTGAFGTNDHVTGAVSELADGAADDEAAAGTRAAAAGDAMAWGVRGRRCNEHCYQQSDHHQTEAHEMEFLLHGFR